MYLVSICKELWWNTVSRAVLLLRHGQDGLIETVLLVGSAWKAQVLVMEAREQHCSQSCPLVRSYRPTYHLALGALPKRNSHRALKDLL